jgi:hypothetical protein
VNTVVGQQRRRGKPAVAATDDQDRYTVLGHWSIPLSMPCAVAPCSCSSTRNAKSLGTS